MIEIGDEKQIQSCGHWMSFDELQHWQECSGGLFPCRKPLGEAVGETHVGWAHARRQVDELQLENERWGQERSAGRSWYSSICLENNVSHSMNPTVTIGSEVDLWAASRY